MPHGTPGLKKGIGSGCPPRSRRRAAIEAAGKLAEQGYDAAAVDGGMKDWVSEDYRIQPTVDPDEDTELGLS